MTQLQIVFQGYEKKKIDAKELKRQIKEALASSQKYQEIKDKLEHWNAERKQVEAAIMDDFTKEIGQLDDLKTELDDQKQMMTDIAINSLQAGEMIEVEDKYGNKYIPVFSVKFTKVR